MAEPLKYTVVIERSETGYGAYVPDLPGCGATGKTETEVRERIRAAIEIHLHSMREDGDPIPRPTSTAAIVEVAAQEICHVGFGGQRRIHAAGSPEMTMGGGVDGDSYFHSLM